jgi:resuscitation-promoting factor RpfB
VDLPGAAGAPGRAFLELIDMPSHGLINGALARQYMKTFFQNNRGFLLTVCVLAAVFLVTMKPVLIQSGGKTSKIFTHAATVAIAVREAGFSGFDDAIVSPAFDAPVTWGMTINVTSPRQVEVSDLGGTRWVTLPAATSLTVGDVLDRAGITLRTNESVLVDGSVSTAKETVMEEIRRIDIVPQVTIVVQEDGQETRYGTVGPTVGDALWRAGVRLRTDDAVDPPPATLLAALPGEEKQIRIMHAAPITIQADGRETATFAAGATVGEALAHAGFALTGMDYSVPDETASLPADGVVRIVRVREELLREQTPIAFDSKTQPAADLEIDQRKIVQPGAPGVRERIVRVRYEDGVEVSRAQEAEQVLTPPQSRINGYGTKIVPHTAVVDGQTITYWRMLSLYATAYSPCRSGVPGKCYPGTSGGYPAGKGIVAMVYSWWQLFNDQKIYVPGYGFATVGDTGGGAPAGNHYWIDLGYDDSDPDSVLNSWGKYVNVYFLMPAQANPGYILP